MELDSIHYIEYFTKSSLGYIIFKTRSEFFQTTYFYVLMWKTRHLHLYSGYLFVGENISIIKTNVLFFKASWQITSFSILTKPQEKNCSRTQSLIKKIALTQNHFKFFWVFNIIRLTIIGRLPSNNDSRHSYSSSFILWMQVR